MSSRESSDSNFCNKKMSAQVYKQWSPAENGVNRWGGNVEPVSLLGNTSWATVSAGVSVKLGSPGAPTTPPPTPPPTPVGDYANFQNQYNGLCLDVAGKLKADGSTVRMYHLRRFVSAKRLCTVHTQENLVQRVFGYRCCMSTQLVNPLAPSPSGVF